MSDNVLQPDLDVLHESAIDLLTDISDTMAQGLDLIDRHQALIEECHSEETLDPEIRKKIVASQRYVNSELEKVKNVEVTMTIVAPTSAGKSTILNAIAGTDLLPSAHDATTILPTEIAFVAGGVSQPKLMLDKTLLDNLRQVWRQLHEHIHRIGIEEVIVLAIKADFPRSAFIRSVFENPDLQIESEVRGVDRIRQTLVTINNLLRLGSILKISTQFLSSLTKIPRIETPLPPHLSVLKATGKLVLVDTPGANEGNEDRSVNLANIVKDRLQASSLVLLVLNYGTFGQTDPEKAKQMVDEIAEIKGRDRVYLVVNQIDRRDPKNPQDLTSQQVLDIAKTKYGVDDADDRVFEISARDAFLVTNFQFESQFSPSTPLQEMQSLDALGEKYYGRSWSKKRSNLTADELREMIEEIWGGCGFDRFLERAILTVMSDVKARVIQTGLNDSSQMLQGFESCVMEGRGVIDRDIQQLGIEIDRLETDLNEAIAMNKNYKWETEMNEIRIASHNLMREKASAVIYWNKNKNRPLDALWGKLNKKLDSLDGRVFAKLKKGTFFWQNDVYEIDTNVMRDTWKLIAEVSIDTFIEPKLLAFSYLLGDNFKITVDQLISSWNSASINYYKNILLKAEKRISKNFQFHFIPDWTESLFRFYQKPLLTAGTDESVDSCVGARYESYHRKLPKIHPQIESVSHWLSSELILKIDGKRLDSTEIHHNFIAISEQLRLKLKQPIDDSIADLIAKFFEIKEFPVDTYNHPLKSMEFRIDNFIRCHTKIDERSGEAKIYLRKDTAYPFSCCDRRILFFTIDGFPSLDATVEREVNKVMEDYFRLFNEEINLFLMKYRENLIFSISYLKETDEKYSPMRNEYVRLIEIGTDLIFQQEHLNKY